MIVSKNISILSCLLVALSQAYQGLSAPLLNASPCGGFPMIMNMPGHWAFLSGGTDFEVLFMANNAPAECRNITVDFHLYYFDSSSSTTPTREFVQQCRPSPVGSELHLQCKAPNVAQMLEEENIPLSRLFPSRNMTAIIVEPRGQLNGCIPITADRRRASMPRFCYSLEVQPNQQAATFVPVTGDAQNIVRKAQSIRYSPDPTFSNAKLSLTSKILNITGAQITGENPIKMSRLYSVSIIYPNSAEAACNVIYNDITDSLLSCIVELVELPQSVKTGISARITVGNLVSTLPVSVTATSVAVAAASAMSFAAAPVSFSLLNDPVPQRRTAQLTNNG